MRKKVLHKLFILPSILFSCAFFAPNVFAHSDYVLTAETNNSSTPFAVDYSYTACDSDLPFYSNLQYLTRTNSLDDAQPYRFYGSNVTSDCSGGAVYEYSRVAIDPYAALFYLHPPLPLSDNVAALYDRGSSIGVPFTSLVNINKRLASDSPYVVPTSIQAGKVYKLELNYSSTGFHVARHNHIDDSAVFSTSSFTIQSPVYTKGTYSSTRAVAYLVVPHDTSVSPYSKIDSISFRNTDFSASSNFDAILSTNPTINHDYVALPGTSPFKFPVPVLSVTNAVFSVYDYDEFDFEALNVEINEINQEAEEQARASDELIKKAQNGDSEFGFLDGIFDSLAKFFKFSVVDPFSYLFSMFSDDSCVDIPIIASMLSSSPHVCSWWDSSVRSVLTPVFSVGSTMLLWGFVVSWLKKGKV